MSYKAIILFPCFLVFFSKPSPTSILELRSSYLAKKNISTSTFLQTQFDEKDAVIKNLVLFESYLDKDDFENAFVYYELLKSCFPISQIVNFRLGEYYFKQKNFVEAKKYFEECVKNDAQFHEARKYLSYICFKIKDYEQAFKHSRILSYFKPDEDVLRIYDYVRTRKEFNNFSEIKFTKIKKLITDTSVLINVGISTKDNGRLIKIDCVKFFVSDDFEIFDDKNKKVLVCNGGEKNLWTIVYRTRLGQFGIILPHHNKEIRRNTKYLIVKPKSEKSTIVIYEYKWFKNSFIQNKEYRGEIVIKQLKDQIVVINKVKLDEYLYSVVAGEIGKDKPYEALKTQAVVARTVALYRKKTKTHKYFDVCSGQHCQVYDGVKKESEEVIDAVNSTVGEVIVKDNFFANLFFHANCGGLAKKCWTKNELIVDIINKDYDTENLYYWYLFPPALNCQPSEYVHAGFSRWVRIVGKNVLEKYLNEKYRIGRLKNIQIVSRDVNYYVKKIKIVGTKKTVILSKEHLIRNIVPLGPLRSTSFIIEFNKNVDKYYFIGAGWGHGVGMCQSGVSNLAKQDKNYVDIIKHYYPDCEIKKIY